MWKLYFREVTRNQSVCRKKGKACGKHCWMENCRAQNDTLYKFITYKEQMCEVMKLKLIIPTDVVTS